MRQQLWRDSTLRMWATFRECGQEIWPAYLLASLLIFWGFTWSLPDGRHITLSFHADENAAIWAVNQIHLPGLNPHWFNWGTALFYQVYAVKTLLFSTGLADGGDNGLLLIGRAIVWASALGMMTCLFLIARRLFDLWTARVAAILLAVLPGYAINSHYFKTDVPMAFWLMAAMVAGYRLLDTGRAEYVYLLGLLTGYSASTKYSAATLIPAGLVFIALSPRNLSLIRAGMTFLACVVAGFLLGTPRVLPDPREFWYTLHWVAAIGKTRWPTAIARGPAWIDYATRISQLSMTFPVWLAASAGTGWQILRRRRDLLPIWAFLAAYLFLLGSDNVRLMRYVVPLLPFAALFVAALARDLRRNALSRRLVTAGLALLVGYSLLFTASYVRVMTQVDPRVQAGQWIASHVPRDAPFPVSTTHYLGAPQVQLWGYEKLEVRTALDKLKSAASPYLALSEFITQAYDGALDYLPADRQFFDYIGENYLEVARFENSQRLWGIDSKAGLVITLDWLYPNPRITILRRRTAPAPQP